MFYLFTRNLNSTIPYNDRGVSTMDVFSPHRDIPQPKKNRKPNWSADETLRSVHVVAEKRLLVNGRFSPTLTHMDKKRAWAEITNNANASNPLVKPTEDKVMNKFTVLSHPCKKISTIGKEFNQSGEFLFINLFISECKLSA